MESIKFRAVTIAPKRSIDDSETEIGAYVAHVYGMLTYLETCGIKLTRQKLYKTKGDQYMVPQNKCNNPVADWEFRSHMEYCRINGAPLHIRIERLPESTTKAGGYIVQNTTHGHYVKEITPEIRYCYDGDQAYVFDTIEEAEKYRFNPSYHVFDVESEEFVTGNTKS